MNPVKCEKIFSLMKQFGVEYFKNSELEIKMSMEKAHEDIKKHKSKEIKEGRKAPPPQAAPPVEVTIPHHVNEVARLMKLSDTELVDELFPDYSQLAKKAGE